MLDRDLGDRQLNTDGILMATRDQMAITDILPISDEYYLLPEDLRKGHYPHWAKLRHVNRGESFLLTERNFDMINTAFWSTPSGLIDFYINRNQQDQVRILDIGGGRDGTTAKKVAARYPIAQVVNVDLVAIPETIGNFTAIRGDVCELKLPEASIDFAYSHQVVPFMRSESDFTRQMSVFEGVIRILKPGGACVLDWTNHPTISPYVIEDLQENLSGLVIPKRKSYDGVFLFIAKNPIDPAVIELSAKAASLAV